MILLSRQLATSVNGRRRSSLWRDFFYARISTRILSRSAIPFEAKPTNHCNYHPKIKWTNWFTVCELGMKSDLFLKARLLRQAGPSRYNSGEPVRQSEHQYRQKVGEVQGLI